MTKKKKDHSPLPSEEETTIGQKKPIKKRRPSKLSHTATIVASGVIILAGIHATRAILAPVFIAAFFALLLVLPFNFLKNKMGRSSTFSLITLIFLVVIIGFGTASILSVQLKQFKNDIPHYKDSLNKILLDFNLSFDDFRQFLPFGNEESEKNSGKIIPSVDPFTIRSNRQDSRSGHILPVSAELTASETESNQTPIPSLFDGNPEDETVLPQGDFDQQTLAEGRDLSTEESVNQAYIGPADETQETSSTTDLDKNGRYSAEQLGISSTAAVESSSNALFGFLIQFSGGMMLFASYTFMITLLVIFMLLEASQLPNKVQSILKRRAKTDKKNEKINNAIDNIRRYMFIKTLMSLIVGVCVTVLLFLTHVRYPVLWGIIALLLNFVPNIGSVVAAIPPIILATVDVSLPCGAIVTVFMVLINCVVGYIIEPKFLGEGLDLSPLVVLLSLLFSGWLLGPVGMFLSPPLAVISKIILDSFPETKWIATLMANRAPDDVEPAQSQGTNSAS